MGKRCLLPSLTIEFDLGDQISSLTVDLGFRDEEVASCICTSTMTSSVADRESKCVSGNEQVGFQEGRCVTYTVTKCQGIKDMNMKRLCYIFEENMRNCLKFSQFGKNFIQKDIIINMFALEMCVGENEILRLHC